MDSLDDDEFDKMVEVNIRQLSDNSGNAVASSGTTPATQSTSAAASKRMPASSSQVVASQSPMMSRRPLLQHSQTVAGYHPDTDTQISASMTSVRGSAVATAGRTAGAKGGQDLQQYQHRPQPPQQQPRHHQQQQQQATKDEESEDELSR
jgi:hypothetical protein